jgi:hypothetical protein
VSNRFALDQFAERAMSIAVLFGEMLRDVSGQVACVDREHEELVGIVDARRVEVSVTVPVKSLSFAMNKVCFNASSTSMSGPKARPSSLAGTSLLSIPCALRFATMSRREGEVLVVHG